MSDHNIHSDSEEKFVPLTDNNNNLSLVKIISSIVLLGLLVFCITTGVQYAGAYLENEAQIEFKKEHGRYIKDSDENKILMTEELSEKMKGKMEGGNMKEEEKKGEEVKEESTEGKKMEEGKMENDKKMDDKKMDEKKEDKKMEHKDDHKH